jgi:hypothetical protein
MGIPTRAPAPPGHPALRDRRHHRKETVKTKNTKLHYRLCVIGIAFLSGFGAGSVAYGFLRAHTENGTTWALCVAGAALFVLMHNWLKWKDEP